MQDGTTAQLIELLQANKVDIIFTSDNGLDKIPDISQKVLFIDDYYVVMSKYHPLADRESIALSLLKEDPFIITGNNFPFIDNSLTSKSIMMNACLEFGFVPKIMHCATTLSNMLIMIECQVGVSIVAGHVRSLGSKNIKLIKIEGASFSFSTVMAWKRNNHNPSLPQFINLVDSILINSNMHKKT